MELEQAPTFNTAQVSTSFNAAQPSTFNTPQAPVFSPTAQVPAFNEMNAYNNTTAVAPASFPVPQPTTVQPQQVYYQQTNVREQTPAPTPVPPLGQDEQFVKNEKVLVFHGAMLYEATIMRVNESRPRKPYFLKFTGFGSKYNTWAGSDILIKDLPENRLYQDELKANLQQSLILKNMGKSGAVDGTSAAVDTGNSNDVSSSSTGIVNNDPQPEVSSTQNPSPAEVSMASTSSSSSSSSLPISSSSSSTSSSSSSPSSSPSVQPPTAHDNEDTETDSEEEALKQGGLEGKSAVDPSPTKAKSGKKKVTKSSPEKTPKKSVGKTKSKDQQTPKSNKKKKTSDSTPPVSDVKLYCLCKKPELWPMIGCDTCADWFHLSCVGLTPSDTDTMDTYACPNCKGEAS